MYGGEKVKLGHFSWWNLVIVLEKMNLKMVMSYDVIKVSPSLGAIVQANYEMTHH